MGWEALQHWPDAERIAPLSGGVANDVWKVRVGGRVAVARLGRRSDADLAWETDLMLYLDGAGLTVPVPIPKGDGRLFAQGLVVMTYLEGKPPESAGDWRRVAEVLAQLHALTSDWPQRPGWCASTDLLTRDAGTRIDLTAMPAEAVARCRSAWSKLRGLPRSVVHGNPANPSNVLVTQERVALIDWDEARVDVPDLDLALPDNAAGLASDKLDRATQASAAWEAAICWDDDYSKRRLAEVRVA